MQPCLCVNECVRMYVQYIYILSPMSGYQGQNYNKVIMIWKASQCPSTSYVLYVSPTPFTFMVRSTLLSPYLPSYTFTA